MATFTKSVMLNNEKYTTTVVLFGKTKRTTTASYAVFNEVVEDIDCSERTAKYLRSIGFKQTA